MAQNQKPAAQKPEDPTVPKKSSKKLVIGAAVSAVLLIAAGGGWYFTKGNDGAPQVEEVKVAPPKPPIFIVLEPFTVNLQRESSDQYLQLGLTLKIFDLEYEKKIKDNLPEIRSKILQLLTTKTASELLSAEGKTRLVKEILTLGNAIIGVVDIPAPAPAPAAIVPAISAVAEAGAEAQPAATPETAAVPPKPVAKPAEKKGIVDVLFTSFIIQ
jgi:flagellar FliL protein